MINLFSYQNQRLYFLAWNVVSSNRVALILNIENLRRDINSILRDF